MFVWSDRHGSATFQRRCIVLRRHATSGSFHSRVGRPSHGSAFLACWPFRENGWQHDASLVLEQRFADTVVVPRASAAQWALLHSQGGPLSGFPFTTLPFTPLQRSESPCSGFSGCVAFTFLSHCPLASACVAVLSTAFGHHRASCSRAGVPGRRGFAMESAVARVCREAGDRVSANVFLRDLDLPIGVLDQRRIEVIAERLPVFHRAQLAIDDTLVSPLRADGEPHRRCLDEEGAALIFARSAQGAHVSRAHRRQRSCQTRCGCG